MHILDIGLMVLQDLRRTHTIFSNFLNFWNKYLT